MDSSFNNRDFERFVKQNADQYRMFPSEKVWGEIHATLHTGRRRWYALGLALLLITSSVVTWVMLMPGKNKNELAAGYIATPGAETLTSISSANQTNDLSVTGPVKPKERHNPFAKTPEGVQENFLAFNSTTENNKLSSGADDQHVPGVNNLPAVSVLSFPAENDDTPPVTAKVQKKIINRPQSAEAMPAAAPLPVAATVAIQTDKATGADESSFKKETGVNEMADDELNLPAINNRVAKKTAPGKISKKLSWQLYITPTISYRTLSENMTYLSAARYNNVVNGGTAVVYPSDVNTMVNHRPDLGFQLGVRSAYPVSKWFSLTGGFQFSVSKYDIKAYQHPTEMATIALADRTVAASSRYRNTNGYKESWLRNFYFSASLPIGAELRLSDGAKNYFGIAGTLQPTYVLDNRAYLISSDYKNYAEIPSLTRHWNMNTSFEIFSAHQTGKVKWRVGPQVRYQLMSSFSDNYPIKEHLFDFGLKLGVQLK